MIDKYIANEPVYAETFNREYNLGTGGGDNCGFKHTHPERDTYNLDACIDDLQTTIDNGQQFMAKNLIWGQKNPDWLVAIDEYDERDAVMKEHITTVMQGVKAGVDNATGPLAWFVVNESQSVDGLKPSDWYPLMPDFVDKAFIYARAADPDAILVYCDFNVVYKQKKQDNIYDMLKDMIDRGIPVDAFSFDAHVIHTFNYPEFTREGIGAVIRRFGDLGLLVYISEMDVMCEYCDYTDSTY